jgi:hypothetical protein
MYRKRRRSLRRRRRATAVAAFAAILAMVVGVPTLASANQVDDLLNSVGLGNGAGGGAPSGGSSAPADTRAGAPPTYTPPLHGSNPHGQGTDAVVDLTPGTSNPYSSDPSESGEEVIVGDSRGEQGDSGYQGSVTLAYLFGQPVVQVTSNPGESNDGPLQPLQTQLLDQICDGSDGQVCLTVLGMHSSTTSNSSTNSFQVLGADLGGQGGISADVLSSNGNISDDGTCQTSHGDSNVASVSAGGNPVVDALQGSSTSTACNDGSQSVDQSSTTLKLGGNDVPIPDEGCPSGSANTNFDALSPLAATVCNADDTNSSQTGAPYGVREALTVFALITGDTAVLKATTAGPESHAVAPTANTTPPTPPGGGTAGAGGKGGNQGGNAGGGNGAGGAGSGSAASEAAAGNGELAFTGADLLALGLVGSALILGGLALTTAAGRRHRQTV